MPLIVCALVSFGFALLFASLLYWLDRYEKEPLLLLGGVFLWGAVVAAGSAFLINTFLELGVYIFVGSEAAAELTARTMIAPLVEESLKGLAVLGVFLVFRREFDSVLDGIIYAGIVALGFAATENTYYIFTYGYQEAGWAGIVQMIITRLLMIAWAHPFFTAFTGIGLAAARLNRSWFIRILAPLLGFTLAVGTHAIHNALASLVSGPGGEVILAISDWSGWLFMFGVVLWATGREQKNLRLYLNAEVQAGTITPAHLRSAASAWRQMFARLAALFTGRFRKTARFYQVCGEYAHKRSQYASLGDEGGNLSILQGLRGELAALAPYAQL
jgi:RsiW-degrading membrane proteinase PrsW (M82 family)